VACCRSRTQRTSQEPPFVSSYALSLHNHHEAHHPQKHQTTDTDTGGPSFSPVGGRVSCCRSPLVRWSTQQCRCSPQQPAAAAAAAAAAAGAHPQQTAMLKTLLTPVKAAVKRSQHFSTLSHASRHRCPPPSPRHSSYPSTCPGCNRCSDCVNTPAVRTQASRVRLSIATQAAPTPNPTGCGHLKGTSRCRTAQPPPPPPKHLQCVQPHGSPLTPPLFPTNTPAVHTQAATAAPTTATQAAPTPNQASCHPPPSQPAPPSLTPTCSAYSGLQRSARHSHPSSAHTQPNRLWPPRGNQQVPYSTIATPPPLVPASSSFETAAVSASCVSSHVAVL
jgi:hypothetical protein